jgi:hypothetical protein
MSAFKHAWKMRTCIQISVSKPLTVLVGVLTYVHFTMRASNRSSVCAFVRAYKCLSVVLLRGRWFV